MAVVNDRGPGPSVGLSIGLAQRSSYTLRSSCCRPFIILLAKQESAITRTSHSASSDSGLSAFVQLAEAGYLLSVVLSSLSDLDDHCISV